MVAMGSCMSTSGEESEQRKRSNKIDKDLEEDSKRLRRECKILLLGTSLRPAQFWTERADPRRFYCAQAPARAESRRLSSR